MIALIGCGNGRIDTGEQCDDGAGNSLQQNARCRTDCSLGRCGDGITDTPLETCDAGSQNGVLGSGCDASCHLLHASNDVLPGSVIELPFFPAQNSSTTGNPIAFFDPANPNAASVLTSPSSPIPPSNTASGPATLAIMALGASAGYAWRRRHAGKKNE